MCGELRFHASPNMCVGVCVCMCVCVYWGGEQCRVAEEEKFDFVPKMQGRCINRILRGSSFRFT